MIKIRKLMPTDISNCTLWLDATDEDTINFSTGSSIQTWGDRSGNGNHVTQATPFQQPQYLLDDKNGNNVVSFTAIQELFFPAGLYSIPNGDFSGFVVVQETTPPNAGSIHRMIDAGNIRHELFFAANWIRFYNNTTFTNVAIPTTPTIYRIYFFSLEGTTQAISINGSSLITDANGEYIPNVIEGTIGRNFGGNIGEFMLFNRAVNSNEREAVEGFLSNKWAINLV